MKRVGVAMSGGVDSTAAALLLQEHYQVSGFLMDIGQPGFDEQAGKVQAIADRLDIKLHIVNLKERFEQLVVDYFTTSYRSGRTPNPCMICNKEIKCGLFLERILAAGADLMATGHYVRLQAIDGGVWLCKGVDRSKDQSYFLARLQKEQLEKMVFPLGSMLKKETYTFVESRGFRGFRGTESQDICFLKGTDTAAFLSSRLQQLMQEGPVVTVDGREIGRHSGLHRYTIGQRRGLGLPDQSPWYVCRIDVGENRLIVGKNQDLFNSALQAVSPNWLISPAPQVGDRFQVKIRYSHPGAEATIAAIDDSLVTIHFDQPQRGVAPGQFVVFYDRDRVAGSAEIKRSCR